MGSLQGSRASQESFVLKLGNAKLASVDQPNINKSLRSLESKAMRDDISSEDYNLLTMLQTVSGGEKLSATAAARFEDSESGKRLRKQSMDSFDFEILKQFQKHTFKGPEHYRNFIEGLENQKNLPPGWDTHLKSSIYKSYIDGLERLNSAQTVDDLKINRDSAYYQEFARYAASPNSWLKTHKKFAKNADAYLVKRINAIDKIISGGFNKKDFNKINLLSETFNPDIVNNYPFLKSFMNYYPERMSGISNRENVQDAMVAKPGGAVDMIFSNLKSMTGSATQASSNISGLFASSEVNAFSEETENEIKEAEAKFNSLLANAKNKNASSKINLKKLRKELITTGLFDDMLRPDFVSPSTYRPTGDSAVAASYQDGKPAQFSHDDYPQGELGI